MSKILIYSLEVSVVLATLYLLYWLFLRQETFFSFNRFFLICILIISYLIPLMSFDFFPSAGKPFSKPLEEVSELRSSYYESLQGWISEGRSQNIKYVIPDQSERRNYSWFIMAALIVIYCSGLLVALLRTIWISFWMLRLSKRCPQKVIDGVKVIKIPYQTTPFSFLGSVYVHESTVENKDFDKILDHEKEHIRQQHSFDLIFVQLLAAGIWYNPVVWLLIKSLKTTHEYIVDRKMINQGYSLVEYQTLLLSQLISNNSYGLVHNFNLSFIKKRITMLKLKKSGWAGKARVALVLSSIVVFSLVIVQCNSRFSDQDALEEGHSLANNGSENLNLPILPGTGQKFDTDFDQALYLAIDENKLYLNGKQIELGNLIDRLKKESEAGSLIAAKIDRDQSMEFVSKVLMQLRIADRRKMAFLAVTNAGESLHVRLLLPPALDDKSNSPKMPILNEEYIAENNIELLKVDLGESASAANQTRVYDFVMNEINQGNSNYVVSANFSDDASYQDYLANLHYVQEGFYKIYNERALRMFGKSYSEVHSASDPESKQAYQAIRKGVPMAISLADN